MSDFSGKAFILVDDDPDSLHLMEEILTLRGARVHFAANGQQFMELLRRVMPAAIVVDLAMPSPDGWELLRRIRMLPQLDTTPVVAVTSFYSDTVAREAEEAGFSAFLRKPLKAGSLIAQLETLLGHPASEA